MYKIISNKAKTYSCTCPVCNSYFLFTQGELQYQDAFSDLAYFDCPCCGAVLTNDKAEKAHRQSHFNEVVF